MLIINHHEVAISPIIFKTNVAVKAIKENKRQPIEIFVIILFGDIT